MKKLRIGEMASSRGRSFNCSQGLETPGYLLYTYSIYIYLSIYLFIYLSIYLFIYLSIYLYIYIWAIGVYIYIYIHVYTQVHQTRKENILEIRISLKLTTASQRWIFAFFGVALCCYILNDSCIDAITFYQQIYTNK